MVDEPGATVRLAGCCTPVPPDEVTGFARAAREQRIPKLGLERIDGEPVIGSGLEEQLIAAGFSRQPRRLVAAAG